MSYMEWLDQKLVGPQVGSCDIRILAEASNISRLLDMWLSKEHAMALCCSEVKGVV